MATQIEAYVLKTTKARPSRRGICWSSWAAAAVTLVGQLWVVTSVPVPGRAVLLLLSIVVEYAAIWWCESRSAWRDL